MKSSYTILLEREAYADIGRLEQFWLEPATFAFLPERTSVSVDWIQQKLAELPQEYSLGHFILLTSGSTGRPKLVVGRRERAESLVVVLHRFQNSEPVTETILALPLTYCYAFINQWLWAKRYQRTVVVTPGLAQAEHLQNALHSAHNAMICLVGAQVPLLLRYFQDCVFPGVIRVHFAGSRFPQEHLGVIRRMFPSAMIFNNYGCAEAMPRLTLRRAEQADVSHHIGWPLPGIELKTDDIGRLLFRSSYGAVALLDENGLLQVGENTWVPSGDLARLVEDGHWELLGRDGDVFKRYGEKVSLPQILNSIQSSWRGQADTYREIDQLGEAGYVLVLAPHPNDDDVSALMKQVRMHYARAHWPLRVVSLNTLPMLANGKVDHAALQTQADVQIHWKQHI